IVVRDIVLESDTFHSSVPALLRDNLVTSLSKSFNVLERERLGSVMNETEFYAIIAGSDHEIPKAFTELFKSDQILLVALSEFRISTTEKWIAVLDEFEVTTRVTARAHYR